MGGRPHLLGLPARVRQQPRRLLARRLERTCALLARLLEPARRLLARALRPGHQLGSSRLGLSLRGLGLLARRADELLRFLLCRLHADFSRAVGFLDPLQCPDLGLIAQLARRRFGSRDDARHAPRCRAQRVGAVILDELLFVVHGRVRS